MRPDAGNEDRGLQIEDRGGQAECGLSRTSNLEPRSSAAREWRARFNGLNSWARLALVIWVLITVGLCVRAAVAPRHRYLYPVWAQAGERWVHGINVYYGESGNRVGWRGFRYTPGVAVLFAPMAFLPERLGAALWSLLNSALFLGACLWWARSGLPALQGGHGTLTARQLGFFFVALLPLSFGNLTNGQTNSIVIALLLGCVTAAASERWNLAAALVALAGILKVYPLAVGLLLAVVYPKRFAPRLVAALGLAALLPFLFQRPAFVAEMYATWWQFVNADDRKHLSLEDGYRDLWQLFRVWHVPMTAKLYLVIQLTLAGLCALLCVGARLRGCSPRRLTTPVVSLGVSWMMLCGPATESCTFIQLAPVLAWCCLRDMEEKRRIAWCFAAASWWLFLGTVLAVTLPKVLAIHGLGLHPLAVLLLSVSVVAAAWRAGQDERGARSEDRGMKLDEQGWRRAG
jgi:hypothetical protein